MFGDNEPSITHVGSILPHVYKVPGSNLSIIPFGEAHGAKAGVYMTDDTGTWYSPTLSMRLAARFMGEPATMDTLVRAGMWLKDGGA
jgi:hypothetical protein